MKITTDIMGALRTAALSIVVCCVVYTAVIWTIGQVFVPVSTNGSLVQNVAGKYVGSRHVAQKFTLDKYFHSRPSAADHDGRKSSGSNLSPASDKLTQQVQQRVRKYGAGAAAPLPLDMATASGSGLDPHISLSSARFQIPRVAKARGMSAKELAGIVDAHVEYPGGIMRNEPIVNVLLLNLAVDKHKQEM